MSNNTYVLNLAEYEKPNIVENRQSEWVTFGKDNEYFDFLIERYKNSTTNNAVINAITHLIYGRGLSALDANRKPNEYAMFISMLAKEDVRKLVTDFYMLGQGALQIHYSNDRKSIVKAYHIPVQLLAPEKCDSDGEINNYFYCDNWKNTREYKPRPIPAFGKSKEAIEILYIRPYSVGMKYFNYPFYQGALPYATLEEEISDYLINDVQNGFSGTKVVNIIGSFTEEEQRQRSNKIQQKLTGSKGQKVIVSFSENKEMNTDVNDIPLNDAPEHYQYLSDECTDKILRGHKVVSGLIFGITKANGFSSNADELKTATTLFDNMVIRPIQDMLCDAIDQILVFNGISLKLYFRTLQPLEFIDLENTQTQEQVAEKTGTQLSEIDLSQFGEYPSKDWLLIDEFEVDYETDEQENLTLSKEVKPTLLSRIINLVSTGDNRPNLRSKQDKVIDGIKFITRYVYAGEEKPNGREFCKQMMSAKKVYRKEDIMKMSQMAVNPGLGPHGSDTYDIFLYKGGANCHHRWNKQVYATFQGTAIDINSPQTKQVAVRKAEKLGYVVKNNPLVSTRPIDTPTKGYLEKR